MGDHRYVQWKNRCCHLTFAQSSRNSCEMSPLGITFIHVYIQTHNIWKHRCLKKYVHQVEKVFLCVSASWMKNRFPNNTPDWSERLWDADWIRLECEAAVSTWAQEGQNIEEVEGWLWWKHRLQDGERKQFLMSQHSVSLHVCENEVPESRDRRTEKGEVHIDLIYQWKRLDGSFLAMASLRGMMMTSEHDKGFSRLHQVILMFRWWWWRWQSSAWLITRPLCTEHQRLSGWAVWPADKNKFKLQIFE